MRKGKRFTPTLLARFAAEGRGSGTGPDWLAWHRVTRSDPPSIGRSHLIPLEIGRHLELLSDKERITALFATMAEPDSIDLLEEVPLVLEPSTHELARYDAAYASTTCPGTVDLARKLGIKHPRVQEAGASALWRMTTDLVMVVRQKQGNLVLLCAATKASSTLPPRQIKLLQLEEAYWSARAAEWLLITPDQYDPRTAECISRAWPFALLLPTVPVTPVLQTQIQARQGRSLTSILQWLAGEMGEMWRAQAAFWQAVWLGQVPMDLRRGWRPHEPVWLMTPRQFAELNPISSHRSAVSSGIWSTQSRTGTPSALTLAK